MFLRRGDELVTDGVEESLGRSEEDGLEGRVALVGRFLMGVEGAER